jgi:hypothetical protein
MDEVADQKKTPVQGGVDPFSTVEPGRDLREMISLACGATGFPEPLLQRARRGERQALTLLSKLIERRSDELVETVVATAEEIRALIAEPPTERRPAAVRLQSRVKSRRERQPAGEPAQRIDRAAREFPEHLTVVDVASPEAEMSELEILPEEEVTTMPSAVYLRMNVSLRGS